jgi:cyclase
MKRIRVIPTLLLHRDGLVKTARFKDPLYIGDPINTLRIFNEKEVDEIVVLDIDATRAGRAPDVARIGELAGECFMPLAYGGGVSSVAQVEAILRAGVEKVVINSAAARDPGLVEEAVRRFGSQAIVVSIDVRRRTFRGARVCTHSGTADIGRTPVEYARAVEALGAGEILLTAIDREGTYAGYDLDLVRQVAGAVGIPVIASGGARGVGDFVEAARAGASAVAAGSLFVFSRQRQGILINFPEPAVLRERLYEAV